MCLNTGAPKEAAAAAALEQMDERRQDAAQDVCDENVHGHHHEVERYRYRIVRGMEVEALLDGLQLELLLRGRFGEVGKRL